MRCLMSVVYFRALSSDEWPRWAEQAQCVLCEDTKGMVAETDKGVPLAAAIFDNWTYTSCNIHIVIEKPIVLKHGFLNEIGNYIFNTCGRIMLLGCTPANNVKALKFNKHAGMKEVYRLKDGYDVGIDYVFTQMLKDECKWIDHGQEIDSRAA